MTDFDTAAARRITQRMTHAALLAALAVGLAACETSGGLFGSSGPSIGELPPPVQQAAPRPAAARLSIAPVIGAPDGVAKQLAAQLASAVESRNMTVVAGKDDRVDYVLRGYVVASKDRTNAKIAYIWDVTDPAGKRVNRITGEELIANPGGRDPWSLVSPEHSQTIAQKTATSLAAWLPGQGSAAAPQASAAQPPAGAGAQAAGGQAAPQAGNATQAQQAVAKSNPPPAQQVSAGPTADQATAAAVPPVVGAPGDGNATLAAALQRELAKNGVAISEAPSGTYRVVGKVELGAPKDGRQQIKIDWQVRDATGKSLGTVSQKNEIPQGSLDGAWGRTADAAAAAAAQGILKLLPPPR